ncbi:Por secretion system C-terminal sorting domain-containing protein [Chryseobacterium sp. RU37D]|uniref:T9SS type A sorting domain-containing protein n=1 Tax=Chryseobacterium sp. RU37D TaxID=1907397 RepID=UPI0009549471|nr:T9SS type A sorting domain-containing protein [Chryseobacterium sp. RU37D]SIQ20090.1 Por secretion system C-terminal sorting domain-containing protein [Chryseobacterium sp. RU37D]
MKKKIFSMIYVLAFGLGLKSQTCASTANIPPNGTLNINGINVTSSSIGTESTNFDMFWASCTVNVTFNTGSLFVGQNGAWSETLNFDKPVNDLVFLIAGLDPGENYNFISNNGSVSITPMNTCYASINANTITSVQAGGGGVFKIHAPNGYQQLTINDPGTNGNGSLLAVCSASIFLGTDEINSNTKDDLVSIYPNPVQNNFTISSKDNLRSYEIFDESGRKVMSSSLKGNKQEVDISSLIKGNYIVSIETKQRKINKKISKN